MKKLLLFACCILSLKGIAQYTVTSITYSPDSFNTGTPLALNDDQFSPMIQMPFSFCFFGNVYNRLAIGSNGVITFDSTSAGAYCSWPISSAVPSPGDPHNSIFMPWQDLFVDTSTHFFYNTYGSAPNRRFAVSCYHMPMYSGSCMSKIFTGEIMLYETSNVIEFHVQRKEVCPAWNGGYAIEGIQNASGTQAFTVPGRNYPTQWTANNDAYRFTPSICPTGIQSPDKGLTFSVFPNPASSIFSVNASGMQIAFQVELIDLRGRTVFNDELSLKATRKISLEGISPGIYFVRIISETGEVLEVRKQEVL